MTALLVTQHDIDPPYDTKLIPSPLDSGLLGQSLANAGKGDTLPKTPDLPGLTLLGDHRMTAFFQGLSLGLAYVAPIGLQNLFVINSALSRPRSVAFRIAGIVIFFDIP